MSLILIRRSTFSLLIFFKSSKELTTQNGPSTPSLEKQNYKPSVNSTIALRKLILENTEIDINTLAD